MSLLSLFVTLAATVATASADSWSLNSAKAHFMGSNSGIPGGSWPSGTEFNSTLSFNITLSHGAPESALNNVLVCDTFWAPKTAPSYEWHTCTLADVEDPSSPDGETFEWQFVEGSYVSEAKFTLGFQQTSKYNETHNEVTASTFTTTNNSPSSPDSYLTCLGGAPFTGITCNTNGQLSSKRTPAVLGLTTTFVPI